MVGVCDGEDGGLVGVGAAELEGGEFGGGGEFDGVGAAEGDGVVFAIGGEEEGGVGVFVEESDLGGGVGAGDADALAGLVVDDAERARGDVRGRVVVAGVRGAAQVCGDEEGGEGGRASVCRNGSRAACGTVRWGCGSKSASE